MARLRRASAHGAGWRALALLVLALLAPPAAALDPQRAVRQFTHVWYENQLPQSTVLGIAQDPDGAIWLATYGGLVRYSGAGFAALERSEARAMRSTAITALAQDRDGSLWIGTLNGGLYRRSGGRVEAVILPAPLESVFGLLLDRDGDLWLATNAGIARRHRGSGAIERIEGVPLGPYRGLASDPADGSVWIGVDGTGVAHWRAGKVEVFGTARGLPSSAVYSLATDSAGELWVGTQAGLVRYVDGGFRRDPRTAALDGARIYALHGDRDGNLWVAAQDFALCRLNAAGLGCEADLAGLGHDIVRAMFEDREGSLWIGTTNGGVHRLSDSKLVSVNGRLPSHSVRAVYEDRDGVLWAATDGAGLVRLRGQSLEASPLNAQLLSPYTRALAGDAVGNLWLGSIEGLSRIAPDGRVRNFRPADGLPGAIVFALEPRAAGGLWIGTTLGLAWIEGERIQGVADSRGMDVRSLYEAPDGRLWVGLRSGLRCLIRQMLTPCDGEALPQTSVFAFRPMPDGSLWLGTSLGLVRWRDGRFAAYADNVDLPAEPVFGILDDGAGALWLSTNHGLLRVAQADIAAYDRGETARIASADFGKSDGMLSAQGNGASQTPAWRGRDGRLWFGTTQGIVQVDPRHLRRNTLAPPVAIERVLVDGKPLPMASDLRLGPRPSRLEFRYAGMSYVAPEAVHYRYRLEGYERDWIDAEGRRSAEYTNLPPGHYTFRVMAANNDGVWSARDATLAFAILPDWYETIGFRALAATAFAGALLLLYRLRLWRLRTNERALRREVAQRTQALREANAELQRLAALDGLTRIANRGAFDRALREAWELHRATGESLALLLCDIDDFKAYNDRYGHLAGDAALIGVAQALAGQVRGAGDLAARFGGEELALLLCDCDAASADAVAQRLLEAVRSLGIEHGGGTAAPYVTVSIGVATLVPDAPAASEHLLRMADVALYRAKAAGRDRAVRARVEDALRPGAV